VSEPDDVRAQALEVAAGWSPPDAPESWRLTAALFLAIAGHDRLLAALAGLPAGRLPALLASAAISFLVSATGRSRWRPRSPSPAGRSRRSRPGSPRPPRSSSPRTWTRSW
jgi:hypothetical protein